MAVTVWLGAPTLGYPRGSGHLWAHLNWALSLRAVGCEVVWLDRFDAPLPAAEAQYALAGLRRRLEPYGLDGRVAIWPPVDAGLADCVPVEAAQDADVFLSMGYDAFKPLHERFRRRAVLDIDPGLTQLWCHDGLLDLSGFHVHLTIGETVGRPEARFPDAGFSWSHVTPAVALDRWPVALAAPGAPFTTVSQWSSAQQWVMVDGRPVCNDKRTGFLPLLELPRHTSQPLELALGLSADAQLVLDPDEAEERRALEHLGWRVVHSETVASTPWDYQRYIASSRGEFGCAKPSHVLLQTAWVSDRTVCYLASGKPAVVQHTGPSRLLPQESGMFRVRDVAEASAALELVAADYENQCRSARSLAEELFDGRRSATRVLEAVLP